MSEREQLLNLDRRRFRQVRQEPLSRATRRVLTLAQEEAMGFNHNYIGTEHILLGLTRDGSVSEVLSDLGIEPNKIRSALEFIIGRGVAKPKRNEIGVVPRVEKVVKLAVKESQRRGLQETTPFHLLTAVVKEGEGIGAGVLETLAVTPEKLQQAKQNIEFKKAKQEPAKVLTELRSIFKDTTIDQETKDRILRIVNDLTRIVRQKNQPVS